MDLHRKIYPGINFSDPTFRVDDAAQYDLAIFLNDAQFLFSVANPMDGSVKHVQSFNFFQVNGQREFAESVKVILDAEDLFSHPFRQTSVALHHEQSTLVPNDLFDTNKPDAYLTLNTEPWDDSDAAFDRLDEADAINVYAVPNAIKQLLDVKLRNVKTVHASTPLLKQTLKTSSLTDEPSLYVYVQPKLLQVVHARKGKLLYFNSFAYSTPEDFVYYILYVCHHLHLDPEKVQLQLLGEVVKDSVVYEFTYKYVRNVQFGKRPDGVKIHDGFNMPEHFYYNLFCVGL